MFEKEIKDNNQDIRKLCDLLNSDPTFEFDDSYIVAKKIADPESRL